MKNYLAVLSDGRLETAQNVVCQAGEEFPIDCVRKGVELIILSHNMPCGIDSFQQVETADIPTDAKDWGRVEWQCQ